MGRVRRPAIARSHARARHESARDGARQDGMFLATSLAAPRVLRLTGIARCSDPTLGPQGERECLMRASVARSCPVSHTAGGYPRVEPVSCATQGGSSRDARRAGPRAGNGLRRPSPSASSRIDAKSSGVQSVPWRRNPRTGENIAIAASKSPAFKVGKTLRDAVRG